MNDAHLHLIIAHLPIVGIPICAIALGVGLVRNNPDLKMIGRIGLLIFSLSGIAVFLTGEGAEEIVEHLSGVAEHDVEVHEEAAEKVIIGLYALAGLSLVSLVFKGSLQKIQPLILLLSLVVSGMLVWTANLGGVIRHTEIKLHGASAATSGD